MIVTVAHLRTVPGLTPKPGFCARGGRRWFARHGLDWTAFVRSGIEAQTLVATGDGLAMRLVEHARSEVARGQ